MDLKKAGFPVLLAVLCLCLPLAIIGQSPVQKDKQVTAVDDPRTNPLEDAHQRLIAPQTDKGKEAVRMAEELPKSLTKEMVSTANIPRKNVIDEHLFSRMEHDGIPHANLSSDEEFIRRVYLDAQGLLPSPDAIKDFLSSKDPDKRDKLIDSLIGTEEFAEQWAWFYGDLFRLMNMAGDGMDAFQSWNRDWLRVDRPYNDVVTDLLTGSAKFHSSMSQLAFFARPLRNNMKGRQLTDAYSWGTTTNRLDALDESNIEISRIFLGVNIECISCHDGAGHLEPVNLYLSQRTREEFAQQAAFLGKMTWIGGFNGDNSVSIMTDDAKGYNTADDSPWWTEGENRVPRDGRTYDPAFIFTGERPRPGMNPRLELARMVVNDPQFARAAVNLIWTKLMVVGFVENYDSFDLSRLDPKNPPPKPWTIQPNNPELLEALAQDFRTHNHSMHRLMKLIMKSSAYQLSSRFPGQWNDSYTSYFPRKYVRVLTGPEVMDAVAEATAKPYQWKFLGTTAQRVKQVTDIAGVYSFSNNGKTAERGEGADTFNIMTSFFQGNRQMPVPPGNRATPLQAMLLMTSSLMKDRVLAEKGTRLQQLMESGKADPEIIEEVYLATLSRSPRPEEKKWALETLDLDKNRKKGLENLQWTLFNSPEFLLNH